MSQNNFLANNECLVYLDDGIQPTSMLRSNLTPTTHIARILKSYIKNKILYYDVELLTDNSGHRHKEQYIRTVTGDNIVSNRTPTIPNSFSFYHFNDPIQASGFVIDTIIERPIELTSRSGFGSGIYGLYLAPNSKLKQEGGHAITLINPYIILDKEHGQSLTTASMHTNRYIDYLIQALRHDHTLSIEHARYIMSQQPVDNLVTLWNIVFYRSYQQAILDRQTLIDIISQYAMYYLTDTSLIDTQYKYVVHEMPINHIMRSFQFDGLLATDYVNNGWDRGCVSYNYGTASIIVGSKASY